MKMTLHFTLYGILLSLLHGGSLGADPSNTKVHICGCKNSSNISLSCLDAIDNITIPVINPSRFDNYSSIALNSFDLEFTEVLKCAPNKLPTLVSTDDFFFFSTGQLIHLSTSEVYSQPDFCVQPSGHGAQWQFLLCLKPPRIPLCCSSRGVPCPEIVLPVWFGASPVTPTKIDTSSRCDETNSVHTSMVIGPHSHVMYETYSSVLVADVADSSNFTSFYRYYANDEYCLEPKTVRGNATFEIVTCRRDFASDFAKICRNATCIRKCCPTGTLQNADTPLCQEASADLMWRPSLYHVENTKVPIPLPSSIIVDDHPLQCKRNKYMVLATDPKNYYVILENGSLYTPSDGISVPPTHYCVDNFLTVDHLSQEFALICFPDEPQAIGACAAIKNILIPTLLIVSCVFLAITLSVYAFIPELHAKLHGKSLSSHVTALLLAYLFLTILRLVSDKLPMYLCRSFALVTQVSFLAAFFWLNIMCFDIWWTLRSMRPVTEANDSTRRRFIYYSLYAWGCPLAIGLATLGIGYLPQDQFTYLVLPGFGVNSCWFQDDTAKWVYLYSFILVLTLSNIIYFIGVTIILIQAQRANNSILRTPNLHHQERVWIYLKLFIIMGITWVCEVISFQHGACEYWFITDVINSLQGLFIFLIFICKKSVYHKLPWNRKVPLSRNKRNQGTNSYGSSSLSTQQTSLESSTRKLSTNISYHLSKLQRDASAHAGNLFR